MDKKHNESSPAFTGFGAEWRPSNLTPSEARAATSWVEAKIDRRSMLTNKDRVADIRDAMWQLEKEGEILSTGSTSGTSRWWRGPSMAGSSTSHHQSVAPQVVRPMRQHPRLPVPA